MPIISLYVDKAQMDEAWKIVSTLAQILRGDAVMDKEDENMFVLTKNTGRPYFKTRKEYSG